MGQPINPLGEQRVETVGEVEYLLGPRLCGRCKQVKVASLDATSEFSRQISRKGGFTSVCKECRKGDTRTDKFKARRRELYKKRRATTMLEVSTSDQTASGLTIHKERSNYNLSSAVGILKLRYFSNDNDAMSGYFGVNQHTLMNWQREGCPKRMTNSAWAMNREMLSFREQLLREGKTEDAAMYLRIMRQEGWNLGHLE